MKNPSPPIAYLITGYLGAGKTTLAKRIEAESAAVRFSLDEWVTHLFGDDPPVETFDDKRERVRELMQRYWLRLLGKGCDVVLDEGFWSRSRRGEVKTLAREAGAVVRGYVLNPSEDEMWRRCEKRNRRLDGSFFISRNTFDVLKPRYEPPDESEGFVPIDNPLDLNVAHNLRPHRDGQVMSAQTPRLMIRAANQADIPTLIDLDNIARADREGRRDFIRTAIEKRECHVAISFDEVVGYVVLNYHFYGQGFIDMLYLKDGFRGQGIGGRLVDYVEARCRTLKLFTSTNVSNQPMQKLMAKKGYEPSGEIHNLDEGDPEIVYCKYVNPSKQGEGKR